MRCHIDLGHLGAGLDHLTKAVRRERATATDPHAIGLAKVAAVAILPAIEGSNVLADRVDGVTVGGDGASLRAVRLSRRWWHLCAMIGS